MLTASARSPEMAVAPI
jgi:hypothetical protein